MQQAKFGLPDILDCQAFIFTQHKYNDEWELDDGHSNGEKKKRLDDVPHECNARSEVNFGQLIYLKSRLVNNVEVETEQPAPDSIVCYESTTGRTGCEEFEAYHCNYKNQRGCVFGVEKQFPIVNKDSVVKAGERFAFFFGWFDFFWLFVIFGRDYEKPAAGCASCALSGVLIGKSDYLIAIGAKELDCHLIVLRIVYIVLRFLFGTLLIHSFSPAAYSQ